MPFNGSGVFNRLKNWVLDAAQGYGILPDHLDTDTNDIASGLSMCITKDGQQVLTADIPWGGFGITGLGSLVAKGGGATMSGAWQFTNTVLGVTATYGTTGTQLATLDYVLNQAMNSALPNQSGAADKIVTSDGTNGSWTALLKAGTLRWADSSDTTKRLSYVLSGITTGTTRNATVPDFDFQLGTPYLKVSDQKTSGTAGGSSTANDITQTRVLNTVEKNTIVGASLSSNTITLPAGTYIFRVRAPASSGNGHKAFLYNSADSTYPGIGSSQVSQSANVTDSTVAGSITIATSKTFTIRHYTVSAVATNGLGYATSVPAQIEVYTEAEFWKVA